MSTPTVFVIKNQSGLFLNKQLEWIDAGDGQPLYRTAHRDEAVNTVFEVSSKDIYLRAEAVACPVDAKGQPAVHQIATTGDLLTTEPAPDDTDIRADAAEEKAEETVSEATAEPATPVDDDAVDSARFSSPQ